MSVNKEDLFFECRMEQFKILRTPDALMKLFSVYHLLFVHLRDAQTNKQEKQMALCVRTFLFS